LDWLMRSVPRLGDQLKGDSESQIQPVTTNSPNNGPYLAKIFTPAFGKPAVEEHFKGDFRFGIKPVIAKEPIIG